VTLKILCGDETSLISSPLYRGGNKNGLRKSIRESGSHQDVGAESECPIFRLSREKGQLHASSYAETYHQDSIN